MVHIVIDARSRPSSTGRYIDRLLEHLQKIDTVNTYTVLVRPDDSWKPIAKNFKTVSCPYKQFSFNPLSPVMFGRWLQKLSPDLVHFAMSPQEPLLYFGKRVTTTHDLTMLRYTRSGRLPVWLHWIRMCGYRFLLWRSHKSSARIIAPSNFVKQDVEKLHPFTKGKITVTYEASEPRSKEKPVKPAGLEGPFILHVGSPFPHKNIARLIQAFEILKSDIPDLQLVLAGKREYYFDKLAEHIKDSLYADSIHIPGFVSEAELAWLYKNASAYVLPSLSEGFGLPGLEAFTYDCPLVSSNATCLPEVYKNGAHYFNPTSVEQMADAISDVLANKDLRSTLIKNGHKIIRNYSWDKTAKQTLAIYNQAM